jgi:hypothetical protein
MTDAIVNGAWQAGLAGAAWFFHSIGLAGLVVILGGLMLLATLSAHAMKFLSQPRSLAVSAAILAAGLAFAWWTWPVATASMPSPKASDAGTRTQPEGRQAKKEPVPPKAAEASEVVKMPVGQASLPWDGPMPVMPMIAPSPVLVLPPMISERVKLPPVTVPQHRHATPQKSHPGHTTVTEGSRSPVGSMRPERAVPPSGRASGNLARPNAGFGQASPPPLTPKQQRQRANENYNRLADRDFQRMYGNMMRGFIPAGPHVGGMGGHMGGMGHAGGHHR